MKFHCGILAEDRERHTSWRAIHGIWALKDLDEPYKTEFEAWMSMPGFSLAQHCYMFGFSRERLIPFFGLNYDKHKRLIAENWISITREDAMLLSSACWGVHPPVIVQLFAMKDYLRGQYTYAQVAEDYRVTPATVRRWVINGVVANHAFIPPGFELLIDPRPDTKVLKALARSKGYTLPEGIEP